MTKNKKQIGITMKKISVFSIVTVLIMGLSLSSCLKSNDDATSIEKEWEEWVKAVQSEILASIGTYGGYMYYRSDEATATQEKMDSVAAEWIVRNDSTMDLLAVPTAVLVKQLPEKMQELKTAIAQKGSTNIRVNMIHNYRYHSPLEILVYPEPVKFDINYENGTHEVEIRFYDSEKSESSRAQYLQYADATLVNISLIRLFVQTVSLDGKVQYEPGSEAYLWWYGNKKY